MRISDWSSDVCSSDLLVKANHRIEILYRCLRRRIRIKRIGQETYVIHIIRLPLYGSADRGQSTLIFRDRACIVGSLLQLLTSSKVSHSLIESGDLLLGHLAGRSLRRRTRKSVGAG